MFKPSNDLEKNIIDKNLVRIKNEFNIIVHQDRSFSTGKYGQTLDYVKAKNIEGLFVSFDGEAFKPIEEWDFEYWAYMAASLMDNFCEERIEHLMEVSKTLYPAKINSSQGCNSDSIQASLSDSIQASIDNNNGKKIIPTAIMVVLVIVCMIAIVVGWK